MKITTAKEVWISYPEDHRMFHIDILAFDFFKNILLFQIKNQVKNGLHSCELNLCNCIRSLKKKFSTLMEFEFVTSRYRCNALTN